MMQSQNCQNMNRSVQQNCNGQNHGNQARGVQSRNVQNQGGFVPSSCAPRQYTRTSSVQQGCPGAAHPQNCKEMNGSEPKSSGLSKQQLMKRVTLCGFACTDAVLYLDTHPDDAEALSYFKEHNRIYQEAVEEYSRLCGPLTLSNARHCGDYWNWVNQPWPWQ